MQETTFIKKLSLYFFCLTPCFTGIAAAIHGGVAYTGALILKDAGYDHYSPKEAALSGIIGGAIITMGLSLLCAPCGIYNMSSQEDKEEKKGVTSGIAATIFSTMAGWAILKAYSYDSEMTLGTIIAASAVGFGVTSTALICLVCCCSTCAICLDGLKKESEEVLTPPSPIKTDLIYKELQRAQGNNQHSKPSVEMTPTKIQAITLQL